MFHRKNCNNANEFIVCAIRRKPFAIQIKCERFIFNKTQLCTCGKFYKQKVLYMRSASDLYLHLCIFIYDKGLIFKSHGFILRERIHSDH